MKYMGSKNRHAKEILPIILQNRTADQWYVEPFVGGFNIIDKVDGKRLANDSNLYLIELFRAIQSGWMPPETVTEAEYQHIRRNKEQYPAHLVGFVGFGCSYSGKWFGGYARGNTSNGEPRNYCNESRSNILKQAGKLQGVVIENESYLDLAIPRHSIVYCDPPYASTTQYKDKFDHDVFWQWVRDLYAQGHQVFVSEYTAPDDFEVVWSKRVNNTLVQNTGSKQGLECLFTLRQGLTK